MGSPPPTITMVTTKLLLASGLLAIACSDFVGHSGRHNHNQGQGSRSGRQEEQISGGIDFSGCEEDPETGLCCVEKEETVTSLEKEPILECTHKNVEQCHYPYVPQFTPSQEEVCEGQGPEECRTVYESSCTTKYVEKQPGKFV